jgi:carbamoylphosphate synthase small subunit
MPTVLQSGGLRVVIYPNDHRPAHVHVIGNGCEAVFILNGPEGPSEIRENFGFSRREVSRIAAMLDANLPVLVRAWERIHG